MRRLLTHSLRTGIAIAAVLLSASSAPTLTPPVVALIDALERAMPLTPAKVAQLLPPPASCRDGECGTYASRYRALPVGGVDARGNSTYFVVALSGIGGDCVPVVSLLRRYGVKRVENGCTDGATCMYAYAPRPWGSLFLSLPDNGDVHACAREIILNSDKRS